MFGRKYFEKQFGWQFETDETGLLYRRNMRDAPVRVTVAERDAFIEDFGRKAVPLFWSLVAAALIVQIGPAVYAVAADVEFQIW